VLGCNGHSERSESVRFICFIGFLNHLLILRSNILRRTKTAVTFQSRCNKVRVSETGKHLVWEKQVHLQEKKCKKKEEDVELLDFGKKRV